MSSRPGPIQVPHGAYLRGCFVLSASCTSAGSLRPFVGPGHFGGVGMGVVALKPQGGQSHVGAEVFIQPPHHMFFLPTVFG